MSAVNGVGLVATVVARVGFVVNIVVPHLFMSIVVLFVVPAVPTCKSAPSTTIGSFAYQALATSVPVAPIAHATAKLEINASAPIIAYLSELASILAIVLPIIVIVVLGFE